MPGGSRGWHASVQVPQGVVLIGGEREDGTYSVLSSVERYNPGLDTFTTLTSMPVPRTKLSALVMSATSELFVAGGETAGGGNLLRTDAIALPGSGTWIQGADLVAAPARAAAAATPEGGVVISGGYNSSTAVLSNAIGFSDRAHPMYAAPVSVARYAHTSTLLGNGKILLAGGITDTGQATDTAEFVTSSTCNEGDAQAPVVASWGSLTSGTILASTTLSTQLKNTTTEPLSVSLSVRARGLDGRDVTREVWSGTIAAGHASSVSVSPSFFPVQSVGSRSSAELIATVTGATNFTHLIGVKAASRQLVYVFDTGYSTVALFGDERSDPDVLEGVSSLEDVESRIVTLGAALETKEGQVWDGSAMVDVTTLGDVHDSSGYLTYLAAR